MEMKTSWKCVSYNTNSLFKVRKETKQKYHFTWLFWRNNLSIVVIVQTKQTPDNIWYISPNSIHKLLKNTTKNNKNLLINDVFFSWVFFNLKYFILWKWKIPQGRKQKVITLKLQRRRHIKLLNKGGDKELTTLKSSSRVFFFLEILRVIVLMRWLFHFN